MLSLIIPTYDSNTNLAKIVNKAKLIDAIEIVVVDDFGSEYASDVVEESDNVKVVRLSENRGAGYSRNVGLDIAKYPFVSFVDADDDIDIDALIDICNEVLPLSQADVFFFKPTSHTLTGRLGQRHKPYEKLVSLFVSDGNQALRYKYHVPWSKIYSRSFINKFNIRFDELSASNDVIFSLLAGLHADVIEVSQRSFYSVLEHSSGLTGKDTVIRLYDRLSVTVRYNTLLERHHHSEYSTSLLPWLVRLAKLNQSEFFKYLRKGRYKLVRDFIPGKFTFLRKFT